MTSIFPLKHSKWSKGEDQSNPGTAKSKLTSAATASIAGFDESGLLVTPAKIKYGNKTKILDHPHDEAP